MLLKIKSFPAKEGDSFFIQIKSNDDGIEFSKNILVDGGSSNDSTNEILKEIDILKKKGESIDLLILTHIDKDHIEGIINLYNHQQLDSTIIKKVWFNSGQLIKRNFNMTIQDKYVEIPIKSLSKMKSFSDGNTFESLLMKSDNWDQQLIYEGHSLIFSKDVKISVLSPSIVALKELSKKWEHYEKNLYKKINKDDKKKSSSENDYKESIQDLLNVKFKRDNSKINNSSIAFLLEVGSMKIIMSSDANPLQLEKALKNLGYSFNNKIKLDFFKIPHHGSKYNSSNELIELIDCENYLISTDGKKHNHPHKEAMAKYLKEDKKTNFYFNYKEVIDKGIFSDIEMHKYNISLISLSTESHCGEKWVWKKSI